MNNAKKVLRNLAGGSTKGITEISTSARVRKAEVQDAVTYLLANKLIRSTNTKIPKFYITEEGAREIGARRLELNLKAMSASLMLQQVTENW
jgi:predicted transcriptional regulator